MEKDLNWAAIKEDEGKYALGYILAKELENQALLRGSVLFCRLRWNIIRKKIKLKLHLMQN